MSLPRLIAILLVGASLFAGSARATPHKIPIGSITDHSNPNITGSIAWYLATYGGGTESSPNTFYLTDHFDGTSSGKKYFCSRRLILPPWARLTEDTGVQAYLECSSSWVNTGNGEFIRLGRGAILLHVEVHCAWKANIGVYSDQDDIQIIDARIHNTARVPGSASSSAASHCIYLADSSNVKITNCLLRRAGCDTTELNFQRKGYLIHIIRGTNILIENNDMAVSPSSGIGFVQSTHITIRGNKIADTGRALIAEFISDGITSYHGGQGTLNRVVIIKNNTISTSRNHGIHLSGFGMSLEGNTITGSTQSNIYLGDQRTPQDCTGDVWVVNNSLGAQGAAYSIYLRPVKQGTIHISGNTGSTSLAPITYCN